MNGIPVRILVALGISAVAVAVIVIASLFGGSSDAPSSTTATTSTRVEQATIAPAPISVLPDWYRKGSSRYEERRPVTTVPAGVTPTSTVPPTSSTTATTTPKRTATTVPRPAMRTPRITTSTSGTGRGG